MPFTTVLVANRGEIACRIIRTLRRLGIRSAAVYSDADADARHTAEADIALRLGPAPAAESYMNVDAVLHAVRLAGADAVHPGYGFLSESPELARACAAAGVAFIGPDVSALELMGNKISARKHAASCGVPVVPGVSGPGLGDEQLLEQAADVGYPLLVKPAAGGGGQGMYPVAEPGELSQALRAARRFAAAAFGDDALLLERQVQAPRHIEVQILADAHGHTVHLGERECSLQRRRQKVIEETPSPLLDADTRSRICAAACAVASGADYTGAGTVEFLVSADAPGDFYFLEMNTRLQVEHPITELVTGLDLVEWQLRIAAGEPLDFGQPDVSFRGHAVEARVYAEDPAHGFLPSAGAVLAAAEPSLDGVRVDSSLHAGMNVSPAYDPLLAKTAALAPTRTQALDRLAAALADTWVAGVHTNIEYLTLLLRDPDVRAGRLDTGLLERKLPELVFRHADSRTLAAAALFLHLTLHLDRVRAFGDGIWHQPDGWRLGGHRPVCYRLDDPGAGPVDVLVGGVVPTGGAGRQDEIGEGLDAVVLVAPVEPLSEDGQPARLRRETAHRVRFDYDGASTTMRIAAEPGGRALWIGDAGWACRLGVVDRREQLLRELEAAAPGMGHRTGAHSAEPDVRSPLPGVIASITVEPGEHVAEGHPLLTIEAMKMEHRLTAPVSGTVTVFVSAGDAVDAGQLLARIADDGGTDSQLPAKER